MYRIFIDEEIGTQFQGKQGVLIHLLIRYGRHQRGGMIGRIDLNDPCRGGRQRGRGIVIGCRDVDQKLTTVTLPWRATEGLCQGVKREPVGRCACETDDGGFVGKLGTGIDILKGLGRQRPIQCTALKQRHIIKLSKDSRGVVDIDDGQGEGICGCGKMGICGSHFDSKRANLGIIRRPTECPCVGIEKEPGG